MTSRSPPHHTFVVAAYGRSPHLPACLDSLQRQSLGSRIVVCTSTPGTEIDALAARHGAELVVHGPNRGIGHDWNMALAQSRTEWTTIAHQDDVYRPDFVRAMTAAGRRLADPLIVFCDYVERCGETVRADGPLLAVKRRLLQAAFLGREAVRSTGAKRRALRFGSPIPCPAVMYHRRALHGFRFREDFKVCLDWAAWLDLAARPGAFAWVRKALMEHRIHEGSETAAGLDDGTRMREDLAMLGALWPAPVARLILASYRLAYARGRPQRPAAR